MINCISQVDQDSEIILEITIAMKLIFEIEEFTFYPGSFQSEKGPRFRYNHINLYNKLSVKFLG